MFALYRPIYAVKWKPHNLTHRRFFRDNDDIRIGVSVSILSLLVRRCGEHWVCQKISRNFQENFPHLKKKKFRQFLTEFNAIFRRIWQVLMLVSHNFHEKYSYINCVVISVFKIRRGLRRKILCKLMSRKWTCTMCINDELRYNFPPIDFWQVKIFHNEHKNFSE